MTQFMCHKLLKFHFGPQINFIIGAKPRVTGFLVEMLIYFAGHNGSMDQICLHSSLLTDSRF
jgi:hypothetical protein